MIKNLLLLFSLFSPFVLTKRTDDLGIHKHKAGIDDIISDVGLFKRQLENEPLHTVHQQRTRNRGGRLVKRRKTRNRNGSNDVISDVGLFKRRRSGSEPEDTLLHTEVETNKRSKKYRQRGNKSKNETPTSTTLLPTVTSTLTSSITPSATSTQTV
jgi:hypothetical protein